MASSLTASIDSYGIRQAFSYIFNVLPIQAIVYSPIRPNDPDYIDSVATSPIANLGRSRAISLPSPLVGRYTVESKATIQKLETGVDETRAAEYRRRYANKYSPSLGLGYIPGNLNPSIPYLKGFPIYYIRNDRVYYNT